MVVEVHVEGIEGFREALKSAEGKGKTVFALFCGSLDAKGKSWCPDCVVAEPVIKRNLSHAPEDAIVIYCGVGGRDYWKDQGNDFRKDAQLNLKCVPTLLCIGKPQRLEEGQCAKDDLVQMLFEDE